MKEIPRKLLFSFHISPSALDRPDFASFYTDWFIQLIALSGNSISVCASASAYIGMYLYIDGMFQDITMAVRSIHGPQSEPSLKEESATWPAYVEEIKFHMEIIK